jgi:putrescine transport system substrate-binding protein
MIPTVLNYMGLDPNTQNSCRPRQGWKLLLAVCSHVRYFHSLPTHRYPITATSPRGSWFSGDILQAGDRAAEEAGKVHRDCFLQHPRKEG